MVPIILRNTIPWLPRSFTSILVHGETIPSGILRAIGRCRRMNRNARASSSHSILLLTEGATADETRRGTISRWTEPTNLCTDQLARGRGRTLKARKSEAWKEILAEVNQAGAKNGMKQCRDKPVCYLEMQYTEANQHNKGTGNCPVYSLHYDELDEVLGTTDVITMPGAWQAGSPASECSTPVNTSVNRKRKTCRWPGWLERRLPRIQHLQMKRLRRNAPAKHARVCVRRTRAFRLFSDYWRCRRDKWKCSPLPSVG